MNLLLDNLAERRQTRRFFNLVAPIYPLIERNLKPAYTRALARLDLDPGLSVLDLATGTGLLAGAMAERGHRAEGIDFAEKLLRRARRQQPGVSFRHLDLGDLSEYPDHSWDVVGMGFLLHGVDPGFRQHILREAARIAHRRVLVFDYRRPGNWLVRFIEWVEGPHYGEFVTTSRKEEFSQAGLKVIEEFEISEFGGCWLCEPPAATPAKGR